MSELRLPKDALDALVAASTTPPPPPEPLGASALARLAEELGQPATDAAGRSPSAPRPRYRLTELIGQGGMGVVWRAFDHDLGREVAVKVLKEELERSHPAMARFLSEARIAGRLQHPGIVPVYELGANPDGRVYLVMKLVAGRTLSDLLETRAAGPAGVAKLLPVFEQVCQTVAYAHARRVIHRDLKPAHVVVGEFDAVQVMDWGIAKVLTASAEARADSGNPPAENDTAQDVLPAEVTQVGACLGTPAYMAPEQAAGRTDEFDERCDVFALGAILFEILTGRLFRDRSRPDSAPAALKSAGAAEELGRLALACLAEKPADRPRNAGAVADALAAYRAAEHERTAAAERRRRRQLAGVTAVAAAVLVSFGAGAWFWIDASARQADQARREAAGELEVDALLNEADGHLRAGRMAKAEAAAKKAEGRAQLLPEPVRRRVEARLAAIRMVERLTMIRLLKGRVHQTGPKPGAVVNVPGTPKTVSLQTEGFAFGRLAADEYADEFRMYGIDIVRLEKEEGARLVRQAPIGPFLVATLDDWALKTADAALATRLREIAGAADDKPNGLAARIRRALVAGDDQALLRLAAEVDPTETPSALFVLGYALRQRDRLNEAVKLLTTAQRRHRGDFWLNLELAASLSVSGPDGAEKAREYLTAAVALSDGDAGAYIYLANTLAVVRRYSEAEIDYREALAIAPDSSTIRINLGYVLAAQRKLEEARTELTTAAGQDPNNALSQYNLGLVLQDLNETAGAIQAYRRAVQVDPDFAEAWNNLGNALTAAGRLDEAVAAFKRALLVRPGYARAEFNLGCALDAQGRSGEAVAAYRQAILHQPGYAEAHYNLAFDLIYDEGKFAEAVAELDRGWPFVPERDPHRRNWKLLRDEAQRLADLEPQLEALLKRSSEPVNSDEACRMALLSAWPHRQLYATATRFYERAFAAEPALADDLVWGYRFHAAECAAQAGCGRGRDAEGLSAAQRAGLRERALAWLRADLALRLRQVERNDPREKETVREKLRYWQSDLNLKCVRDEGEVARLPDPERANWEALWREVAELAR